FYSRDKDSVQRSVQPPPVFLQAAGTILSSYSCKEPLRAALPAQHLRQFWTRVPPHRRKAFALKARLNEQRRTSGLPQPLSPNTWLSNLSTTLISRILTN